MKSNIYTFAACGIAGILMSMSVTAQTIYTLTGSTSGFAGDGGPATAARLSRPGSVRYNSSGYICFADANNERLRRIESGSLTISTVAGTGSWGFSGDGAAATAAQLYLGGIGGDIAFDNSNNMYFSDYFNKRIRKITPAGIISTVAGDGSTGSSGDGGPATAARVWDPLGLVTDAAGNLYIAEHRGHRIRKIDVATGNISTIAGTGTAAHTGDGGAATAADIEHPVGLIFDAAGNLFFAEYTTGSIRKITPAGVISTHATGLFEPMYLDIDQVGNIFAGSEDTRVYRISPSGVVDTVAGNGTASPTGDGGPATAAGMDQPTGVTVLANGNLLISTKRDHRIRIVMANTATITGTASLCAGSTTSLTASTPGAAWKSGNTGVATVSSTGVVTGVSAGTATITYVKGLLFGTKEVTVNVATAPVITATGSALSVPATYASYQWSLGGTPIAGATSATHVATAAGTYAVSVTDAGGCNATSANFVLSTVSVASATKAMDIRLFPNPASGGNFTISIPSAESELVTILVVNAMGTKVYETKTQTNKALSVKLDVPAGVYTVRAISTNANYHAGIVVN